MRNKSLFLTSLGCLLFTLPSSVLTSYQVSDNARAKEELLQQAAAQMQAGDLYAAEGALRKAVALEPNDITALSLLGGVLGKEHKLKESSEFFEKALRLDPGNRVLRRNLAANQIQAGQTSAAISNLELILRAYPSDRETMLMMGLTRELIQDFQGAIRYLEQVTDLVRQHPDHMAVLVRSYYRTGQKSKARLWLSQLQVSAPSPALIYLGAQIALEADDFETAERLFGSIKAIHPEPNRVTFQLAKIRYQTGRFDECKLLLEPIANSPESNGSVLNLLAWCYVKGGDEPTGTKILSFATEKFPAESANFVDLGSLCLKQNNLEMGSEVVRRGFARHPGSGALAELKGEIESKEGLDVLAVQSYKKALQLNPGSREALLGLAMAQTNLLQHKGAAASFEEGMRLFPRDARFYAEYGKVLLLPWASGENPQSTAKAEQLLKQAIHLDDSYSMAHFELGNLLGKSQRAKEALPHLEKAAKLDPGNAQIHFVLARTYRALGRTEEAEKETLLFQKLEASTPRKTPR